MVREALLLHAGRNRAESAMPDARGMMRNDMVRLCRTEPVALLACGCRLGEDGSARSTPFGAAGPDLAENGQSRSLRSRIDERADLKGLVQTIEISSPFSVGTNEPAAKTVVEFPSTSWRKKRFRGKAGHQARVSAGQTTREKAHRDNRWAW